MRKTQRLPSDLKRLEARYARAKRSEIDGRLTVWAFLAFLAGLLLMGLINWIAG